MIYDAVSILETDLRNMAYLSFTYHQIVKVVQLCAA